MGHRIGGAGLRCLCLQATSSEPLALWPFPPLQRDPICVEWEVLKRFQHTLEIFLL